MAENVGQYMVVCVRVVLKISRIGSRRFGSGGFGISQVGFFSFFVFFSHTCTF